jgi:hypothetical protein
MFERKTPAAVAATLPAALAAAIALVPATIAVELTADAASSRTFSGLTLSAA